MKLSAEQAKETDSQQLHLDEPGFRYLHNEDEMAVNKLSEVQQYNWDLLNWSVPVAICTDPDSSSSKQKKVEKNLDFNSFVTS